MIRTVTGYFKKNLKRVLVAMEIQRLSKLTPFDYIRVGSLERVAGEIYENSVAGSVAELEHFPYRYTLPSLCRNQA